MKTFFLIDSHPARLPRVRISHHGLLHALLFVAPGREYYPQGRSHSTEFFLRSHTESLRNLRGFLFSCIMPSPVPRVGMPHVSIYSSPILPILLALSTTNPKQSLLSQHSKTALLSLGGSHRYALSEF
jgi:hypothetical protein